MLKMLNEVFNKTYAWGHDNKAMTLTMEGFLSCYKKLKDENLSSLMKAGYIVKMQGYNNADDYFKSKGFEDIGEFISKNPELDSYKIDLTKFAIVSDAVMESHVKFDDNNKTEGIRFLVKESETLWKICEEILKLYEKSLDSVFKKELQDYFGELNDKRKAITEIECKGSRKFCQSMFFDYHKKNVKAARDYISSIWDKDVLKKLCEYFPLGNNELSEGYGYTCPICGNISNSALNGLKFKRYQNADDKNNPYLYIVSCLNCCEMLSVAKGIYIEDLTEILQDFEKYYITDHNHLNNRSIMKTVILNIEKYNEINIRLKMKISFLNLSLY